MSTTTDQSTSEQSNLKREAGEKSIQDKKDDQFRLTLRQLNEAGNGATSNEGRREKSILKVQKFVNRLKRFVDTDKDNVLSELLKLDVSMHLSEVCDALMESGLRLKDIPPIVEICSLMYRQYSTDFSKPLVLSIFKIFKVASNDLATFGTKRKSLPRLIIELILVGICSESEGLPGIINELCDSSAPEELLQHNIGVIEVLCRKFDNAILGESGIKQETYDAALGKLSVRHCRLSRKAQNALRSKLVEFYRSNAQQVLIQSDAAVKERQALNMQRRINKGSIDAESESKYQLVLSTFNRLQTQLDSLADLLKQPPPTLNAPDEAQTVTRLQQQEAQKLSPEAGQLGTETANHLTMWEDDAEKDFYENILNLSDAIPGSLLGLKEKGLSGGNTSGVCGDRTSEDKDTTATDGLQSVSTVETNTGTFDSTITVSPSEQDKTDNISEKRNVLLEQFFVKLTQASTGAEVDQLTMQFCYDQLNASKANRKKVVKLLLTTKRTDLYLLPTFARFIATIGPYCKDIPQAVVDGVMSDLKDLMVEKDPLKVESKIKAVRYLGELCKFKLIPPGVVLDTLNSLFEDFSHHHAEMACQLIQSCGRFLMCFPGTATRFQNILNKMLRMKNVRNLPVHLEIMVEDTYFQLYPSDRKTKGQKELPAVRQFINYLIHVELHKPRSDDTVLRSIRRLNWDDSNVPKWLKKAVLDVGEHIAFQHIGNVASLLCALVPGRPEFVLQCIDSLLESIQLGLERNDFRETPTRIRQIKFIGELFNFRLFDTTMIFDSLYHLIGFGGPSSYGVSDIATAHKLVQISGNTHLLPGNIATNNNIAVSLVTPPTIPSTAATSNREQLNGDGIDQQVDQKTTIYRPLVDPCSPEDSPGDYFRIRLICVILDTCGQYFSRGSSGEKMDRFLAFFQRYLIIKSPLPMSIQYIVFDTLEKLRPKTKLVTSIEEIDLSIRKLLTADLARGLNVEGEMDDATNGGEEVSENTEEEIDESELSESEGGDELSVEEISEEVEDDDDDDADEDEEEDEEANEEGDGEGDEENEEELSDDDIERHHHVESSVQDELFDFELSELMNDSLVEAKLRSRITNALEDLRLPTKFDLSVNQPVDVNLTEDQLRVRLVTRKGHKGYQLKSFNIPKKSRFSHAVLHKETEDAEEHARMKQFVLDSVTRSHKQEIFDQQNELRQELFVPSSSRYTHYYQQRSSTGCDGSGSYDGYGHRSSSTRGGRGRPLLLREFGKGRR